jgi:hypothetical protein
VDDDVVLEIGFGSRQGELDETDLGVLDLGGTTSEVRCLLVNKDEAINELGVVDGAAKFLGNMDVAEVNIGVILLIDDSEDSIDSHGGQEVRVLRHDLGGREVIAFWISCSRLLRSTGWDMPSMMSKAFVRATWKPSEIADGWIPLERRSWQAFRRAPAITTTEVVPSPASIS